MKATLRAPRREPVQVPGRGAEVALSSVSQRFGELEVLDRVDLAVAEREVVALVGTSGCGKSTVLELADGLQ